MSEELVAILAAIILIVIRRFIPDKNDKNEGETINGLIDSVKTLNDLYNAQVEKQGILFKEYFEQSERISQLERDYEIVLEQNKILTEKNIELGLELEELRGENINLRGIIVELTIKVERNNRTRKSPPRNNDN